MTSAVTPLYDRSVFINCPFDLPYQSLLHPMLFTVLDLGFEPRIASDRQDSGEQRIDKIADLIEQSRFGIHDLCRCQAQAQDELYRLNMPFELGLDMACRRYGGVDHQSKAMLILETKPFRYQAALSDMAGCDIALHGDEPIKVVRAIRNWLYTHGDRQAIGAAGLWSRYNDYWAWAYDEMISRHFSPEDIQELAMAERLDKMREWVFANPA